MRISRILTALCALLLICALPALAEAPILDASAPEAYRDDLTLTEVVISKDTQAIGPRAFAGCVNLKSVTVPYSVTSIHPTAFEGCEGVKVYVAGRNTFDVVSVFYEESKTIKALFQEIPGVEYVLRNQVSPEGFNYVTDEGECTIIAYEGEAEEIAIPDAIDGCTVTVIAVNAFYQNETLKRLSIPGCVQRIENSAFQYCKNLEDVRLEEGTAYLGSQAFYGCALKRFDIPASVQEIDANPVGSCDQMTTIDVAEGNAVYKSVDGVLYDAAMTRLILCPSGRQAAVSVPMGVTVIGDSAFQNCVNMAGVSLPPTVRVIEDDAFWDCDGLTTVELPVSLEKLEGNPFAASSGTTRFSISEANPWFCTVEGILYDKAMTRAIAAPTAVGGRYILPETVKVIGSRAFRGCDYDEIILPEGLVELDYGAFDDCYELTRINLPSTLTTIAGYTFESCESLRYLIIPESIVEIPWRFMAYCESLEHVELPSTLTTIVDDAFGQCESLRHLTIPAGVTSIGDTAFEECENLTLHGEAGSYAEQYAAEHGIPFTTEAEPEYDPNAAPADTEPEYDPEDTSTDAAYAELKKGSKGDAVKALQQKLIELGFLTGKADGDYGNKTMKAVSAFQKSVGMPETGAADSNTQAKLFE